MLKLDERQTKIVNTVGNTSRLKIFLALWKARGELGVYKICKYTKLKRNLVNYHLRKLVESRLVLRKVYGVIPLYTINRESLEANALIEFFVKARF